MADLIDKRGLMAQIRPIKVEDLLGRKPVRLEETRISSRLDGKAVVVTGAAGSIGSELCRQIARFHPKALVALEVAETALFHLEREMKSSFPELRFFGEIGNVQDSCRVSEVFDKYQPSIVYHAAAYKHVPVMESHIFQAVENNVLGTWNVARQAEMHGVSHLVLISSDKAVQPVNVMGLTKRVAEIVINSMPRINASSLSVRFGNVLGSNGSVIPLFQDQISRGGPVTVTHPDMERYFMTIPEAAQLVLQASAMGKESEIFVLDMGQRVKIVDLATNMILLSGLEPEKDIRIQFSGVRPGEKLYEELSAYEEGTAPTDHEKIKVFCGVGRPWNEVEARLNGIRTSCETRDIQELVILLRDLVPEYTPSTFVLEQVAASLQPAAKVLIGRH
jgi:FlaA1/EpsC-like NDP-sugar epimerase